MNRYCLIEFLYLEKILYYLQFSGCWRQAARPWSTIFPESKLLWQMSTNIASIFMNKIIFNRHCCVFYSVPHTVQTFHNEEPVCSLRVLYRWIQTARAALQHEICKPFMFLYPYTDRWVSKDYCPFHTWLSLDKRSRERREQEAGKMLVGLASSPLPQDTRKVNFPHRRRRLRLHLRRSTRPSLDDDLPIAADDREGNVALCDDDAITI